MNCFSKSSFLFVSNIDEKPSYILKNNKLKAGMGTHPQEVQGK
jgi:hypothetical protein